MIRAAMVRRCAPIFLSSLLLGGCFPATDNQLDERKDPHYLNGEKLVQQRDYPGAIDAFEQAVEANSRSASAHFELGWLYQQKLDDPAAAIYHYQRYLKFSINPDKADLVHQQIDICKVKLAQNVAASGPLAPGAQREMDRLGRENQELQARIASMQTQLDQAKAAAASRPLAVMTTPNTVPNPIPPRSVAEARPIESPRPATTTAPNNHASSTAQRTYLTKRGDTAIAIARNHGVSLNALLAANPRLNPNHMQVGQALNIPAP